ncbi:MAG: hypothetical protein IJ943_09385 [Akkermansia sp.]|nr:hypothetical protein [Akkermansia sp.]
MRTRDTSTAAALHSLGAAGGVFIDPCGLDRVDNMELAACLSTLGFGLLDCTRLKGSESDNLNPQGRVTWKFTPTSADGRYTLQQVLVAWRNEAWLSDPNNADPLAYIIAAFRNRQRLMDYIFRGRTMVAVQSGRRWALIPEDCSARVEILAKRHLRGG